MTMVPTLRWRPRGADAELLLTLSTQDSTLRAYVVDGPALADLERCERFLALLRRLHADPIPPAAVFLLGAGDAPGLMLGSVDGHDAPAAREQRFDRLRRVLADPPAYGPWWGPTRRCIEVFWGSFPRYPLEIVLLLGERAALPYEWDAGSPAGPPAGPTGDRLLPKLLIVGAHDPPDGAEASRWDDFLAAMERRIPAPKGKGPARITFTSPLAAGLRLADPARREGWTLECGETCAVLEHPAFRFPQGGGAIPLAVLPDAAAQASGLPCSVFAAPTQARPSPQ